MTPSFERQEAAVIEQFERCKTLAKEYRGHQSDGSQLYGAAVLLTELVNAVTTVHGRASLGTMMRLIGPDGNKPLREMTRADAMKLKDMVLLAALTCLGKADDPTAALEQFAQAMTDRD